jgi:hypothetical protein
MASEPTKAGTSIGKRAIAVIVLIAAAYVLLKIVLHVLLAVSGTIVVILAIVGIIWAIRTL